MSKHLILLAKEPRPGVSKTRLAAEIGVADSSILAESMVLDTLALARRVEARVLVAFAPSDAGPWFHRHAPWAELWAQPEASFGERMRLSVREALRRGATRCVVLGTDTPQLEVSTVHDAFDALEEVDVCLGPAADGGYYLIGVGGDHAPLFEGIPWSTGEVLASTEAACAAVGLAVRRLGIEADVDDAASLRALRQALRDRPGVAPETRRALESLEGGDAADPSRPRRESL